MKQVTTMLFFTFILSGLLTSAAEQRAAMAPVKRPIHVEADSFRCAPGSGDLGGLFISYNEFEGVRTIPREFSWDESTVVSREIVASSKQVIEAYTSALTPIDMNTPVGAMIPHPMAVRGKPDALAKWFSSGASAASRRAMPSGGGDIIPRSFRGSVFPDVLAGAVQRAWASYYSQDRRMLVVELQRLRAGRDRLATALATAKQPMDPEEAAGREAALGLVDLHLGMLFLVSGGDRIEFNLAATSFGRAQALLKESCTPRFHALATLGVLHARASQDRATAEMVLEAAQAMGKLPAHENMPAYCAGGRHFSAILQSYVLGRPAEESRISYFRLINRALEGTCGKNQGFINGRS